MKICLSFLTLFFTVTTSVFDILQEAANESSSCYNSTLAVVVAQLPDARSDDEDKVYAFCPDVVIPIGVPAKAEFSHFVSGDFPLAIFRPNVKIQGNGATLQGGFGHLFTVPFFNSPLLPNLTFSAPLDGVEVVNLNFKGPMVSLDGVASANIMLTGPGSVTFKDIDISDVSFPDGQCGSRSMYVGGDILPQFEGLTPAASVTVSVQGLTMRDVKISNCTSLLWSVNQTLAMSNVEVSDTDGLALLSCGGAEASCTIDTMCVTDSHYSWAPLDAGDYNVPENRIITYTSLYVNNITNDDCPDEAVLHDNMIWNDKLFDCVNMTTSMPPYCPLYEAPNAASTVVPTTKAHSAASTGFVSTAMAVVAVTATVLSMIG